MSKLTVNAFVKGFGADVSLATRAMRKPVNGRDPREIAGEIAELANQFKAGKARALVSISKQLDNAEATVKQREKARRSLLGHADRMQSALDKRVARHNKRFPELLIIERGMGKARKFTVQGSARWPGARLVTKPSPLARLGGKKRLVTKRMGQRF